ncbi:MAG: hypothetical protein KFF77_09705, partial [Bacteroidetes bacterium]|nr:hypothetical protein [Bacteroidota bacterium]
MFTRFLSVLLIALTATLTAQQPAGTMTNDHWDFIGVNRLLMWMGNNGGMAHDPVASGPGLEWPRGSGRYLAFAQGLVWGGQSNLMPHVGGATYRYGWQAGRILPDGTPADPSDPANRVYRVRRFDAATWPALSQTERALFLRDLV